MRKVFTNIKQLLQIRSNKIRSVTGKSMRELPLIENAFLCIENDLISDFGEMNSFIQKKNDKVIDVSGKLILPSWCDSHSHVVYAGDRSSEFVDRINGLSYQEIANRGGGILNSAKKLQNTPKELLFNQSMSRIKSLIKLGTGALEIKSGYGLTLDSELKMLRVIRKISNNTPIKIKSTFLGAHAIPEQYKNDKSGYLDLIIDEMLPKINNESLADFIDVFCEKGYFNLNDTEIILNAAKKYGLVPKIHVNQFNSFGGVDLAVKYDAISVDHLEEISEKDIQSLKDSNTIAVALPGCSFYLEIPYTNARKIIDSGLPLALATDFNPGSAPSGNMNFVVSLACIKMKMSPEEAINAATINGAYAMGISENYGSIGIGKKANLIITKEMDSYEKIPYYFGESPISEVILNGKYYC
jgi:imidazolonepropionase